jgi:hypothetical protein
MEIYAPFHNATEIKTTIHRRGAEFAESFFSHSFLRASAVKNFLLDRRLTTVRRKNLRAAGISMTVVQKVS